MNRRETYCVTQGIISGNNKKKSSSEILEKEIIMSEGAYYALRYVFSQMLNIISKFNLTRERKIINHNNDDKSN